MIAAIVLASLLPLSGDMYPQIPSSITDATCNTGMVATDNPAVLLESVTYGASSVAVRILVYGFAMADISRTDSGGGFVFSQLDKNPPTFIAVEDSTGDRFMSIGYSGLSIGKHQLSIAILSRAGKDVGHHVICFELPQDAANQH